MHSHECVLCDREFTCSDKGCEGMVADLCEQCDPREEAPPPDTAETEMGIPR